jgi:hypothetical protein
VKEPRWDSHRHSEIRDSETNVETTATPLLVISLNGYTWKSRLFWFITHTLHLSTKLERQLPARFRIQKPQNKREIHSNILNHTLIRLPLWHPSPWNVISRRRRRHCGRRCRRLSRNSLSLLITTATSTLDNLSRSLPPKPKQRRTLPRPPLPPASRRSTTTTTLPLAPRRANSLPLFSGVAGTSFTSTTPTTTAPPPFPFTSGELPALEAAPKYDSLSPALGTSSSSSRWRRRFVPPEPPLGAVLAAVLAGAALLLPPPLLLPLPLLPAVLSPVSPSVSVPDNEPPRFSGCGGESGTGGVGASRT